ncbi:MAG: PadR family transcriptional regulator [bacterium]
MPTSNEISTLALAVLGIIVREPCSAYDVRKIFKTTPMGHFSASPGAIYPALKRLEDNGWVAGRVANADTLRPKRVYELTGKGREVLTARLSRKITADDVTRNLDDVMLRFVFMDKLLPHAQIVELLGQLRSEMKSHVASLEQLLHAVEDELTVGERLSMEHGIAKAKMDIEWADRAAAIFQKN